MTVDHQAIAETLARGREQLSVIEPISAQQRFDLEDAYRIQAINLSGRIAKGERVVGYKIGFSTAAMREQMGIASPNYAAVTDAMVLISPAILAAPVLQPRVEPEVLIEVGTDIAGDATLEQVRSAASRARGAIEVVDSVYRDYRFSLEDNTADASSACYVVIGDELDLDDPADAAVELFVASQSIASGTGDLVMGDPIVAVHWLVRALALRGGNLRAGDFVMTGGLTKAAPLDVGEDATAVFAGGVEVRLKRE